MGARPPHPRIPLHQTEILNRVMGLSQIWECGLVGIIGFCSEE